MQFPFPPGGGAKTIHVWDPDITGFIVGSNKKTNGCKENRTQDCLI